MSALIRAVAILALTVVVGLCIGYFGVILVMIASDPGTWSR